MSTSALDSEDLENVPLVRMEDVQPSRNRLLDAPSASVPDAEIYETCEIDQIKFESECVVNDVDDDSNIGSMVSIKSDDGAEDSDNGEMIVPEVLDPIEVPIEIPIEIEEKITVKASQPNQWPTLEIIPGGVIRNGDKVLDESAMEDGENSEDMMYACGQCSKGFKYMFCLVEHVRGHTEQKKQLNKSMGKSKDERNEYVCLHGATKKIVVRKGKRKVPKRLKS